MTDELEGRYSGREHSGIKHLFLREYLESAAYKTMGGGFPVFNYIDGFAGPWSVSDDDQLSDSSFKQAIQTLLSVKKVLEGKNHGRYQIRFCLCEKAPARVKRLRQFAAEWPELEIHVFGGAFETRLDDIAATCAGGFSFTFIDPTGFNLHSLEIANFLARREGDFLLNFMSEHINRYPSVDSVRAAFGRLLADTNWLARFDELPRDLKNEQRIMIILKERMKQMGAARFMPDFEILNPRVNRLQMRLILGTQHPLGVEVFRNVQAKVELKQHEVRDAVRHPGQVALFQMPQVDGVDSPASFAAARRSIRDHLRGGGATDFKDLIGPVLEDAAIRRTRLKDVLVDMKKTGEVQYDLPEGKKKPDVGTSIRPGAAQPY